MKLTVQNVSLSHTGSSVLKNISFHAEQGYITALIGRNGAGKTSLIRCLTGEYTGYSGQFLLDDRIGQLFPFSRQNDAQLGHGTGVGITVDRQIYSALAGFG